MQPNDHWSTDLSYRSCLRTSGAQKRGVPAMVMVASSLASRETPKSAILGTSDLSSRMLSGLRSRCTTGGACECR